jgi:hypothetical protein
VKATLTDRSRLVGVIPMTRRWYDCGNGYGVSAITGGEAFTVAAGLWMDRRPGRLRRLFSRRGIAVMYDTAERVHVDTLAEVEELVRAVAALPPLGADLPPTRLLPDCRCGR